MLSSRSANCATANLTFSLNSQAARAIREVYNSAEAVHIVRRVLEQVLSAVVSDFKEASRASKEERRDSKNSSNSTKRGDVKEEKKEGLVSIVIAEDETVARDFI